ncbi:sensor histidine kinase [Flavisolibacter ginsengisoli]|jgi:signal transduction histidine kinase|uniref:histidine kinase n=1 Tax=Flavisolibacter ginsengisoli DSM 18119 TaxID=1121884 RepID=A0A1M4WTF1_9BACT|nr:response regulator [Flavisolibacter ginsengisoli]SHE84509.1 His Kinase A (phospho-acceptor) domain-containing protein [Flavisolibacter ginsengisoli DSM 18119]
MEIQKSEEIEYKRPVKILAVDDREDNLLSIETILEQEDYTVVKATSGRAALKILLTEQDFTLILMDVQMPDMNGFETASLIYEREKLRHIPIIFITAHNQGEERMYEGYKMGGVDFIYKPINPELLRYKVSVFVELYQKTHQLISHEKSLVAANKKLEIEIEERRASEEKIKLLNQQLVINNQQLKNTIEELDRFAYVASHDLQEPLRKILVFSDKIQTKYSNVIDQEMDRNLAKIVKASERMQLLINDLLRFSRNSSNSEDFTSINLEQLITEVLNDMEVDIERYEAQVKIENLPQVWGISSQMRQLFQNLVSNSLKFRKKQLTPVIHIYSEPRKMSNGQEKELSRIVIQDNGIGFDSKFADDIFTVFKRLHSYHEFEGSGVGLSICKKIVERHNGYISAESEIGFGAKFIIDLPVASEDLINSSKLEKLKSQ